MTENPTQHNWNSLGGMGSLSSTEGAWINSADWFDITFPACTCRINCQSEISLVGSQTDSDNSGLMRLLHVSLHKMMQIFAEFCSRHHTGASGGKSIMQENDNIQLAPLQIALHGQGFGRKKHIKRSRRNKWNSPVWRWPLSGPLKLETIQLQCHFKVWTKVWVGL